MTEVNVVELVDKLIKNCTDALAGKELKVTIADWIRMRELRKKLAPAPPVSSDVTWFDGWD